VNRLLVTLLVCSLFLVGCPKEKRALNAARKAVEVAAQTVDLVDTETANLYRVAATECLEASSTQKEYSACMVKWDKMVPAVGAMKNSLLLVEHALDAWEAGSPNGENNLLGAAGCLHESLLRLQGILRELGVDAPHLDFGLTYIAGLFKGGLTCPIGA
jgi:hypothetical protein